MGGFVFFFFQFFFFLPDPQKAYWLAKIARAGAGLLFKGAEYADVCDAKADIRSLLQEELIECSVYGGERVLILTRKGKSELARLEELPGNQGEIDLYARKIERDRSPCHVVDGLAPSDSLSAPAEVAQGSAQSGTEKRAKIGRLRRIQVRWSRALSAAGLAGATAWFLEKIGDTGWDAIISFVSS